MLKLYEYRKELYKKPILKSLFLEVTLKCNARCEHCGSRCGEVDIVENFGQVLYVPPFAETIHQVRKIK